MNPASPQSPSTGTPPIQLVVERAPLAADLLSSHGWRRATNSTLIRGRLSTMRTTHGTALGLGRMVLQRQAVTSFAGSAHGEHPIVNRKAGVLSAQGSTPPSSINFIAPATPPTTGGRG